METLVEIAPYLAVRVFVDGEPTEEACRLAGRKCGRGIVQMLRDQGRLMMQVRPDLMDRIGEATGAAAAALIGKGVPPAHAVALMFEAQGEVVAAVPALIAEQSIIFNRRPAAAFSRYGLQATTAMPGVSRPS